MAILANFARVENACLSILLLAESTAAGSPSAAAPLPPHEPFFRIASDWPESLPSGVATLWIPLATFPPPKPQAASNFPLDRKLYLSCLWPGLPELWWRGRVSALPTALAFAAAANFLLVARFIYPEWLSSGLVRMAGWVGVAIWLFCVVRSIREMPLLLNPRRASGQPDRFVEAHQAYLRGQWAEAESLLADCLAIENRDPPSLILLCGVYRHTARLEAAQRLLEEIRLTEAADGWWLEVAAEQNRLDRDTRYGQTASDLRPDSSPEPTSPLPSASPPSANPTNQQLFTGNIASSVPSLGEGQCAEVSESAELSQADAVSVIAAELDLQSNRGRMAARAA